MSVEQRQVDDAPGPGYRFVVVGTAKSGVDWVDVINAESEVVHSALARDVACAHYHEHDRTCTVCRRTWCSDCRRATTERCPWADSHPAPENAS